MMHVFDNTKPSPEQYMYCKVKVNWTINPFQQTFNQNLKNGEHSIQATMS